jgi:hypothetical protein
MVLSVDLWLVGVLHDDPLARIQLRSWMSLLSHRYKTPPVFVAAESDDLQYGATVAERPFLAALLRAEWGPQASALVIDLCARSLGFEADAHRDDLFTEQETETYFLDYKRGDAHYLVQNAVFPAFRNRLADPALAQRPEAALARLEEQAFVYADHADPDGRDTTRDVYMAVRLIDRMGKADAQSPDSWAVGVVGAAHLTTIDHLTLANLLSAAGLPFSLRYLGWVPPLRFKPIVA